MRSRIAVLAVSLLAIAGCASNTGGTGTASGTRTDGGTSTRDFPTASAPGTSASAPSTPATSAAPSTRASGSGNVHPVPANPLRTVTVHGGSGVTYVIKIWADVKNDTCFDHAYGDAMITFLTKHPCYGLRRYLGTTTVKGRPVGFAQSSTGFQGTTADPYKWASAFSKLELQDGTGSISDLMREGYRLPSGPTSVPNSDAFNVLGQDDGVTVWDVWYLDGPTTPNAKALIEMTQDLFLQF